jgi:hypothetical protein
MAILALDTVSATCSVTVRTPAGSISIRSSTSRQQAEILLPSIDKALELAGISKGEITAVATAQGPGSFTGLRLSYAAAKAICLSANAAFIPIPTLTAYAYPFNSWGRAVVSVLDAKKKPILRAGVSRRGRGHGSSRCGTVRNRPIPRSRGEGPRRGSRRGAVFRNVHGDEARLFPRLHELGTRLPFGSTGGNCRIQPSTVY